MAELRSRAVANGLNAELNKSSFFFFIKMDMERYVSSHSMWVNYLRRLLNFGGLQV